MGIVISLQLLLKLVYLMWQQVAMFTCGQMYSYAHNYGPSESREPLVQEYDTGDYSILVWMYLEQYLVYNSNRTRQFCTRISCSDVVSIEIRYRDGEVDNMLQGDFDSLKEWFEEVLLQFKSPGLLIHADFYIDRGIRTVTKDIKLFRWSDL